LWHFPIFNTIHTEWAEKKTITLFDHPRQEFWQLPDNVHYVDVKFLGANKKRRKNGIN